MEALRTYIDFSAKAQPGIVQRDSVVALGDSFPIAVLLEHAGDSGDPIVFDSIVVEIIYNDSDDVIVQGNPHDLPVAGELGDNSSDTRDYFSSNLVRAGRITDATPFMEGTPLWLEQRFNTEPFGPFRGRTGRAGLVDKKKPFRIDAGAEPVMVALGKRRVGFLAAGADVRARASIKTAAGQVGSTRMLAVGNAFRGSEVIPLFPAPSVLTVVTGPKAASSRRKPHPPSSS